MTLGYPEMFVLGASLKATRGVISAVPSSAVEDMYLYDAVVNHGNSGGPVCDSRGNVVAVTTIMTNTEGKYGGGIPGAAALAFVQKHVPDFDRVEPGREKLDWPGVDQRVSPSTVLIWTRSKTPGSSAPAGSAGYYEDRDCLVCNGLGALRCGAPGCVNGVVTTRSGRNVTVSACTHCGGKMLVRCSVCAGTGIDPDCVRVQPTAPPPSNPPRGSGGPNSPDGKPTVPRNGSANTVVNQPGSEGSTVAWRNYSLSPALFDGLRTAVRSGRTVDTPQCGSGDPPYREVCQEGGFMIGLYLHIGESGGYTVISAVRPMFLTGKGRDGGSYHGPRGKTSRHVVARPGYAVGAVRVRSGTGIDSLSVVFMRIKGDGLDPNDSYESAVYGGTGGSGREPRLLGGTGAMIVGVCGKTPNDPQSSFIGLGLISVARN